MYLRTTARKNQDGAVVRYLALAHNQRVGAATKANVLLNLGREDRLDPDGLRRLVRSINRYLGEADTDGTDAAVATGADTATDGLRLIASRPAGTAWLLDGLWKALDVDTALRKVLGGRRFTTDVERVLFALVANRAIDPSSKLAAAEWASHDVAIPGLEGMDEDQAYRAMDLLMAADTDGVGLLAGRRARRTPHRPDLATHQPRVGPTARDHPRRTGRDRRPDHRTDNRPSGHSQGLQPSPTAPDHHPRPRLSRENTLARPPAERGHTRPSSLCARSRRSTPRSSPHVCPRTAEPGTTRCSDTTSLRYL
jgi:hypothetical protein